MPKRTTQTIYLLSAEQLLTCGKTPQWWKASRLTPLVVLDPLRFYGTPPAPVPIPDIDRAIGGPWYAGLWVTNNVGGTLLHSWTDDAGWSELILRLKRFRALAPPNLQGLLLDLEYYPATPGGAAGVMDQGRAWVPHQRLAERAEQFTRALQGWDVGGYVTATEIRRLPGLARWLKTQAKIAGQAHTLVLAEDFNGVTDAGIIQDVGCRYVPGFSNVAAAREHAFAWCYQPSLGFLKKT